MSTNSSTSTANSNESALPGNAVNTDNLDSYADQSQSASVMGGSSNLGAAASPASSGGSSSRSVHLHTPTIGLSTYGTGQTSLSSPYCSSRYEGLEMRSPAPHMHGQNSTNSTVDRRSRLQPLTPGASESSAWSVCISSNDLCFILSCCYVLLRFVGIGLNENIMTKSRKCVIHSSEWTSNRYTHRNRSRRTAQPV